MNPARSFPSLVAYKQLDQLVVTMVCDPISAFAIACNILQVVEVGVKTLSAAAACRKSETGALLKDHSDLQNVSNTLRNLTESLDASVAEKQNSNEHSTQTLQLLLANEQCARLSKEMLGLLDTLRIKDKHAVFDSIRVSVRSVWHRDRIEALQRSVSQARDNLIVAFLVYFKYVSAGLLYYMGMT